MHGDGIQAAKRNPSGYACSELMNVSFLRRGFDQGIAVGDGKVATVMATRAGTERWSGRMFDADPVEPWCRNLARFWGVIG